MTGPSEAAPAVIEHRGPGPLTKQIRRISQPMVMTAGFVILSLLVMLAVWLVTSIRLQNDVLIHTLDVQNRVALMLLDLRRTESAQRGFLLTGRPDHEKTYREARALLPRQVEELSALVADNEVQTRALRTVRDLLDERLKQMEAVVRLQNDGRTEEALALVRQTDGQEVMASLRAISEAMIAEEERLFSLRSGAVDRSGITLIVAMIAAFFLLIGLAALSVLLVRRSSRERDEALQALEETNAGLEETVAWRTADLQEANDEIQRFAYIVSHDLRSPLVNIMGFTSELEVIRQQVFDELERLRAALAEVAPAAADMPAMSTGAGTVTELGEDFDEALRFIKSSIGKMDRLIQAILRLSREGRREFAPEPVDMGELIRGVVDTVAHQAAASGTTIVVGDLPAITADRLAVEQVFSNLVDNALKYLRTDVPGRIEIGGRATLTHATYEVIDNGRGIDTKDHKRIFELFRRSGEQDRPGEGIGLAHVRAMVRRMGGTLNVTSELGSGSTFSVMLPRRPRRQAERSDA